MTFKKTTLLELLKFKKEKMEIDKEIECPIDNPLDLNFNSVVNIKAIDYYNFDFRLIAMEQYDRRVSDDVFTFVDYTVKDQTKDLIVKLRYVDGDVLVLTQFDSREYDDGLMHVLRDTSKTGVFEVTDDDNIVMEYGRVSNIKHSWQATIKKLVDIDGNRKITKNDPVTQSSVEYWDFWRDVERLGVTSTELLFVEMNTVTGWFTMWKGDFVDLNNIMVI